MSDRMITLTLPEALYERLRETAEASSLSLEDILTQSIALSLPALEDDLPPDTRSELAALSLLSDAELWKIATQTMDEQQQTQLETLAEMQKHHPLTETEQPALAYVMAEAHRVMLRKAEAYRLLAHRGHVVFASSRVLSG